MYAQRLPRSLERLARTPERPKADAEVDQCRPEVGQIANRFLLCQFPAVSDPTFGDSGSQVSKSNWCSDGYQLTSCLRVVWIDKFGEGLVQGMVDYPRVDDVVEQL